MRVKYVGEGALPLVGTTIVKSRGYSIIRNVDKLKKLIDLGYKFEIYDEDKKEPVTPKEYFGEKEKVEVVADIEVKDEEIQCQAKTGSGKQCQNEAKYPKDKPKYCGIHKSRLEE